MLGDFTPGKTIVFDFNTHKADGTPITLAGTPAISVYKNSTTESTAGVTLTVDYDSRTGMHHVVIDTSADGTFYAAGNDFRAVITAGTVDSISVVGTVVGAFSLSNRSALRPATADRTLVVDAAGLADANTVKIGPSGSGTAQTAVDAGARLDATVSSRMATYTQPTGFLAATFPTTVASTTNITAGTITTVTNLTNNNDKTGYTLLTSPPTAAQVATAVWQDTTAGDFTVASSIGKSLYTSGNAPGAASGLALVGSNMGTITGGTITTVSDKAGYSLSSSGLASVTTWTVGITGNITGNLSGSVGSVSGAVGSVTGNVGGNVVGSVGSVSGAVGSVTGNVGGNVTGSVGSVVAGVSVSGTITTLDALNTSLSSTHGAGSWATATGFSTLDASSVRSAVGLASANLDTQLDALPTAAENSTAVWAAVTRSLTDKTGFSLATAPPTADENAAAILDLANAIESGLTVRQAMRLIVAADAGKVSGGGTTTVTIRNIADTKDRIVATVDSDGNRTAITRDLT